MTSGPITVAPEEPGTVIELPRALRLAGIFALITAVLCAVMLPVSDNSLGDTVLVAGASVVAVAVASLVLVPALRSYPGSTWRLLVLLLLLGLFYGGASGSPRPFVFTDLVGNWWGQGLAAVLVLVFVVLWRRDGLRAIGFGRPDQRRWWVPTLVLIVVFVALMALLGSLSGGEPTTSSILFQWTMPGLSEELFFRGLLLLVVDEAFGRPFKLLGARFGWGVIFTSVLFGLGHGLGGPAIVVVTGLVGFALGWLRERTGSLWPAIVLHNIINGVAEVSAAIADG